MTEPHLSKSDAGEAEGLRTRLAAIADTIQDFASHDFASRAPISAEGDIVDAVAAGVNFLGEELEAMFHEIEKRVEERTAALAKVTEELSHRVMHDELTGLANRGLLTECLAHRIQMWDRRSGVFAVLFIDLDGFKSVNDTHGHSVGDQMLIEVSARILDTVRASDTAARVGGDEFVVLLDEVESAEAAVLMARRLGRAISKPYSYGGVTASMSASIGIALGYPDPASTEFLIRDADDAMYQVKKRGGNDVAVYEGRRSESA